MKNTEVPKFRTDATAYPIKVILLCSRCSEDIRELKKGEIIDTRRGYYCPKCDNGVVKLNMPHGK